MTTIAHQDSKVHDHASHGGHNHSHFEEEGMVACCSHHDIDVQRYMLRYLLGIVLVLSSFVAKHLFPGQVMAEIAWIPALLGTVILAWPLWMASVGELLRGRASTSTLASLAILASMAILEFEVAGGLAFLLLVADEFVRQRAWGAQRAIEALVGLTPDKSRLVVEGREQEVSISSVKVGDLVRVRPGENLPVDGTIESGRSLLNQASLTGEAAPHEVAPGDAVYAGTTNLSGMLDIRVTQIGEDTTIGKVTQLIREAEQTKTPRQLIIELVSRFYVPVALMLAFVVWFLTRDVERAITVLIVACPSALLLSAPFAMVASFASAARLGIMIKQTRYLEAAAGIDTVVLDKTGTITSGKFSVSRLVPAEGVEGAALLAAAVNGEQHSNHPLAKSILETARAARIEPDGSSDFEEIHGRGIRARTSTGEVFVGRRSWLLELFPVLEPEIRAVEPRIEGMSGVHVVRDGKYMGVVGLEDKVRPNAKAVISRLRELGVRKVIVLTGDRASVAERVGRQVGADAIDAECLPEEKHAIIESLTKAGRRVMMIGDGINDGPSLAAADVGVAMGLSGSDIAANSAGVALMTDDLSRIPFLMELARRTRGVITQNITGAILIAVVGLAAAATGVMTPAGGAGIGILLAAIYHSVGDIYVFGNSFRLFRFGEAYTEAEAPQPVRATFAAPKPAPAPQAAAAAG